MALPTNFVESGCQTSFDSLLPYQMYRRILRHCAASICHSIGFDSAQKGSLEALSFLFHQCATLILAFLSSFNGGESDGFSVFSKTCQSSRALCEHTGRSLVNAGDVLMALVNEGRPELANFDQFFDNLRHSKPHTFSLLPQSPTKVPPVLRISDPRPHPSYYPNFLPLFPDSHTYIRTEVRDETDTNYKEFVGWTRKTNATGRRVCELDARLMLEAKDAIMRQRSAFRLHRRHSNKQQKGQGQCPSIEQHNDDYFARILSKEMDEDDGAMEGGEEGGGAGGRNSTAAKEL